MEAAHGNVVRSKLIYIIIIHLDINMYLTLLTGIRKKIPKKRNSFIWISFINIKKIIKK